MAVVGAVAAFDLQRRMRDADARVQGGRGIAQQRRGVAPLIQNPGIAEQRNARPPKRYNWRNPQELYDAER